MKELMISKKYIISLAIVLVFSIGALNSQTTLTQESSILLNLPNEVSSPISDLVTLGNSDANLKRLLYIIGYLPKSEQQALLKAYTANKEKDATKMFDLATYTNEMVGVGSNVSNFRVASKSISNYVTRSSQFFRKGLGCLLKVATQFAPSQTDNTYKQVDKFVSEMAIAQIQANNCRARFGSALDSLTKYRRKFLLTTIANQEVDGVWNNANKESFVRFRFSTQEVTTLVQQYRTYANCEHAFNSAVYSRVLESEQMIAQMPNCKGQSNPLAGTGSYPASNVQTIKYDDQKKPIGIYNANGIRADGKTQNNYSLQGGFGLGNGGFSLNANGTPYLRLQTKVQNSLTKLTADLKSSTAAQWTTLNNKIASSLGANSVNRPTAYLYNKVLSNISNLSSDFLAEFYKGERGDACNFNFNNNVNLGSTDYLVYCDMTSCNCVGDNCPNVIAGSGNINWVTNMASTVGGYTSESNIYSWNFNYSDVYVATFCKNTARYIYVEATDNLLGKMVDYVSAGQIAADGSVQNVNLGASFSFIEQGCLGNFSDGRKNDKDACRDTFNEKCGIEMDYTCSKSGLYSYIPANPVAAKSVPYECDQSVVGYTDLSCAIWINRHFLSGTVTLKPSGFIGHGLAVQNSQNTASKQYVTLRDLQESTYIPSDSAIIEVMTTYDDTRYNYLQSSLDSFNAESFKNDFTVDGASRYSFPTKQSYLTDIINSYTQLNASAGFIQLSFISLMVILLAAILF